MWARRRCATRAVLAAAAAADTWAEASHLSLELLVARGGVT